MVQPLWKAVWYFFLKVNINLPCESVISLLGGREMKMYVCTKTYTEKVHNSIIPNRQKMKTIQC